MVLNPEADYYDYYYLLSVNRMTISAARINHVDHPPPIRLMIS